MSLQCIQEIQPQHTVPGSSTSDVVVATQWVSERVLLTGHVDGTLRAWDADEDRLLAEEKAHARRITSLTATADGLKALTSSEDGSTRLWDLVGLQDPAVVQDPSKVGSIVPLASSPLTSSGSTGGSPSSTALHPSGDYFASTGAGAALTVHAASCENFGSPLSTTSRLDTPANSRIQPNGLKLRFSSSGDILALGTDAGQVAVYQCSAHLPGGTSTSASPVLRATSTVQSTPITALAFDSMAPTGGSTDARTPRHLFVGGDDGLIAMYDISTLPSSGTLLNWTPITHLRGHKTPVLDLATLPLREGSTSRQGQEQGSAGSPTLLLASTSPQEGTVRLWNIGGAAQDCVSLLRLNAQKSVPTQPSRGAETASPRQPPPPPQLDEAADTLSTLSSSLSLLLQIGSQSLYRLSSSTHLQINPSIPPHVHMMSSAAGLVEPQEMKGDIKELVEDFMDRAGSIREGIATLGVERTEEEHVAELKRLDEEMHRANEEYAEALKEAESMHKEVQALLLQSCTSAPLGGGNAGDDAAQTTKKRKKRKAGEGCGAWSISWRPVGAASGKSSGMPVLVVPGPDGGVRLYQGPGVGAPGSEGDA